MLVLSFSTLTALADDDADISNPEGVRTDIGQDFVKALIAAGR